MLYAFVKQILCFLFCILAVITCHVQMLLVADISLALPSNQKPQKNSANGKKNSKVALLLHRRSLKKNCGLAGTYCRSLSPEVAILNETNF